MEPVLFNGKYVSFPKRICIIKYGVIIKEINIGDLDMIKKPYPKADKEENEPKDTKL